MTLTLLEKGALRHCARYPDGMYVAWKPKTMAKLEAKGLVVKKEGCRNAWTVAPFSGWVLTDAGRASLRSPGQGGE